MFKHNWAWIKLATYNSSIVLTRNLRNPRDYAPLKKNLLDMVNFKVVRLRVNKHGRVLFLSNQIT